MLRSSPIQCFGRRVASEELVLVVSVPDDPTARRKLRGTLGHSGVDVVDGSDVVAAKRQLIEAHSEPREMVVRIMEARHDDCSAEIYAALG
jgi:hypothetical protein